MAEVGLPKKYQPFIKEFEKWIVKLGLIDWEIEYFTEDLGDNDACCSANYDARMAHIGINNEIDTTTIYLKKCAVHEALELLMAEVNWLMKSRFIAEEDINPARHKVINTLTRILT